MPKVTERGPVTFTLNKQMANLYKAAHAIESRSVTYSLEKHMRNFLVSYNRRNGGACGTSKNC